MKVNGCPVLTHGSKGHVHVDDVIGIRCTSFTADGDDGEPMVGVAMIFRHAGGELVFHIPVAGAIGLCRSLELCVDGAKDPIVTTAIGKVSN